MAELEKQLAAIKQEAEDVYNRMMMELERNLKPFWEANAKVTQERERLQKRMQKGKIEQETLAESINMVD